MVEPTPGVNMTGVNPVRRLRLVLDGGRSRSADELLLEAGRGGERAFAELYDALSASVYGIIRNVIRDPSLADEVTQEVFVEIWRLAPRFDPSRGSAKAWAATVAHRRAVDRVRSEQSRRNRDDADGRQTVPAFDQVSETVLAGLDRDRLVESMSTLSPAQREAVTLAYYGGHRYRDVAALLGVPEGTVKTRIRDGLIKLRDEMGVIS